MSNSKNHRTHNTLQMAIFQLIKAELQIPTTNCLERTRQEQPQ